MYSKKSPRVLDPDRIRKIDGGFSFVPHQFLSDGFFNDRCDNYFNRTVRNPVTRYLYVIAICISMISFFFRYGLI